MKTLDDVRGYVREASRNLDPASRYIPELLAIIDRATGVADLDRALLEEGRGVYWSGRETFARMTLEEKLRANLITNETRLMRFEEKEIGFLRGTVLPALKGAPARILSLPCSHGEEAVSLAIECLEAGIGDFVVRGYDIQPACVDTARSGRIPLSGLPRYVTGLVDGAVMAHLEFSVADVFKDDIGADHDLTVCRNFLGYFTPDAVGAVLARLARATKPGGWLMVDPFIVEKHPERFERFSSGRPDGLPFFRL